jgi:hypothetical protein
MIFPQDAKGLMLLEGAKLSTQNEHNLRTLTGGSEDYFDVPEEVGHTQAAHHER